MDDRNDRPRKASRPARAERPSPNRSGRAASSSSRRTPPQRRRRVSLLTRLRKDPMSVIGPALLIAAALALIIWIGSNWFISLVNGGTFVDNISVNGIDLNNMSFEQGKKAIEDAVAQRLNTQYTLTGEGYAYSFTPADFDTKTDIDGLAERAWNFGHTGNIFARVRDIRRIAAYPNELNSSYSCDTDKVDAFVNAMYDDIYLAPVDAQVVVDVDHPVLVSGSTPGRELDKETITGQIMDIVATGTGDTSLPIVAIEPTFDSDMAAGSLEPIVVYETDVTFRDYNSRFNVRKALGYFNGFCLAPGMEVSFNAIVGPRNEERGWKSATEYIGSTTGKGFGGGVCQASSTLYGAVLKAGMDIMVRSPHSMTVSYVEPSLDAAVTNTNRDLVFKNNTNAPIYIYTEVDKELARVMIYGSKPPYRYELESKVSSENVTASKVAYINDTEGKHIFYADETPVLYKKGKPECTSQGWIVSYDWETGQEVARKQLSNDEYKSGTDIYWRGVHSRDEQPAA